MYINNIKVKKLIIILAGCIDLYEKFVFELKFVASLFAALIQVYLYLQQDSGSLKMVIDYQKSPFHRLLFQESMKASLQYQYKIHLFKFVLKFISYDAFLSLNLAVEQLLFCFVLLKTQLDRKKIYNCLMIDRSLLLLDDLFFFLCKSFHTQQQFYQEVMIIFFCWKQKYIYLF